LGFLISMLVGGFQAVRNNGMVAREPLGPAR